tara:strand:- start:452 stop:691 length:240 start_codon:yes stop_codon:yes gene_type:complete
MGIEQKAQFFRDGWRQGGRFSPKRFDLRSRTYQGGMKPLNLFRYLVSGQLVFRNIQAAPFNYVCWTNSYTCGDPYAIEY